MTITIEIECGCVAAVFTDSYKRVDVFIVDRDLETVGEENQRFIGVATHRIPLSPDPLCGGDTPTIPGSRYCY